MLKKLLKHELKEVSRYLIPLLLSLVVITIINKIFLSIDSKEIVIMLIKGLSTTFFVVINIAIATATFIIIIIRFYKNLLKDEGYLMFTLPVKVSSHIIAKTIIATFWSIVATLVVVLSITFVVGGFENINKMIDEFLKTNDKFFVLLFVIEFGVAIILSCVTNILQIYASISLGQLVPKHKILASFGAYIGIYTILQIVGSVFILLFALIAPHINIPQQLEFQLQFFEVEAFIHGTMILMITLNVLLGGVFYFITQKILSTKLNLE